MCLRLFWRFLKKLGDLVKTKKEPQRNCEQFPGSSASRSLICVRKRRKTIITKHPLSGGDGGGGTLRRNVESGTLRT